MRLYLQLRIRYSLKKPPWRSESDYCQHRHTPEQGYRSLLGCWTHPTLAVVWEQRPKKADPNQGAEKGDQTPNLFGSTVLFHTDLALFFLYYCLFCLRMEEGEVKTMATYQRPEALHRLALWVTSKLIQIENYWLVAPFRCGAGLSPPKSLLCSYPYNFSLRPFGPQYQLLTFLSPCPQDEKNLSRNNEALMI